MTRNEAVSAVLKLLIVGCGRMAGLGDGRYPRCGDASTGDPAGPHHPPTVAGGRPVTATSSWPVVLRSGVVIDDPLNVALGILVG